MHIHMHGDECGEPIDGDDDELCQACIETEVLEAEDSEDCED